ncbi:MAG: FAD-dependent oxidoreductase [Clostridia bacterium]|nr:FAD-dependent oxidoreductase [Clostridia bacterium]MBQ6859014.1 FAD-dependent oxidoreductase [Clostridia bacterium]MBQ7052626.1 FAD-dependent oxidoreductase [Clostridia bacterium]
MNYDVIIIGAGPGGIFSAYELSQLRPDLKIAVFEAGHALARRHCPIDGEKIKSCIGCKSCSIMSGFGGAGAFSDGKYNITNDFGGTLYEYIGKKQALDLMHYVDEINMRYGGEGTKLYSTAGTRFKKLCIQHNLHLLNASVRHLGTDINYIVLENLYADLKNKVSFFFNTPVDAVSAIESGYEIRCGEATYSCKTCIVSVGRSGSKWMERVCKELKIATKSNRVDIGVRVELPAEVFSHLTDELYESKIVYRTEKYGDLVRTFCMNPKGAVVTENTNGIVTVNGHSYEDPSRQTENTNFALLVAKHFSEPFKDSNGYGESIARLSNMLGGGVMVQRFGDLIRGRRSNPDRMRDSFLTPTLSATPGDLSLVLPKRILDGIIEMIYALDKVAPGTANDDTLLYGVEVKFYNMEVAVSDKLETDHEGLYVIGDGSGITHSLSHASASGIHVARDIASKS